MTEFNPSGVLLVRSTMIVQELSEPKSHEWREQRRQQTHVVCIDIETMSINYVLEVL